MTASRPLRIGVIGSGRADREAREAARELGRILAAEGAVVVCGGLGGVMEAAAEGAGSRKGLVLGFLPGGDPDAAAAGVSLPVATGLGEARNVLVVRASEAVVAVAGGWGTRNEAALCLKLGVPLVGLRDTLGDVFPVERFREPAAAASRALELARERRSAGSGRGHDGGPVAESGSGGP